MKRHGAIRQAADELTDHLGGARCEIFGRAMRGHLAARQQIHRVRHRGDLADVVGHDVLVSPSTSFKRRISRKMTPSEMGSRPTNGSS